MDTKALALAEKDYIIGERRRFHAHPELGTEEYETTKHIAEELRRMGIDVRTFDDITGCVGTLRGGRPGKTVMLRADIDALPIQEADLTKPYASRNPGVMHACGHDCHTAMLLGAAKILAAHREEIPGTVKFIFQMAEEIGTESRHYVEKGCLDGVDAISACTCGSSFPRAPSISKTARAWRAATASPSASTEKPPTAASPTKGTIASSPPRRSSWRSSPSYPA